MLILRRALHLNGANWCYLWACNKVLVKERIGSLHIFQLAEVRDSPMLSFIRKRYYLPRLVIIFLKGDIHQTLLSQLDTHHMRHLLLLSHLKCLAMVSHFLVRHIRCSYRQSSNLVCRLQDLHT